MVVVHSVIVSQWNEFCNIEGSRKLKIVSDIAILVIFEFYHHFRKEKSSDNLMEFPL